MTKLRLTVRLFIFQHLFLFPPQLQALAGFSGKQLNLPRHQAIPRLIGIKSVERAVGLTFVYWL